MSKNKNKNKGGHNQGAPKPTANTVPNPNDEVSEDAMYWVRPVNVNGFTHKGLITPLAKEAFLKSVKSGMTEEEFKKFKFSKWESDTDLEADRRAESIAKQKKNLGLK